MPEMPEVETLRRQLERVVVGQRIKKVEVLREKSFQGNSKEVEGKRIEEIGRKAKLMWWRLGTALQTAGGSVPRKERVHLERSLSTGERFLLVHLKMTGQLVYESKLKTQNSKLKTTTQNLKVETRVVGGHPTADWVGELPSKHTRVILELERGKLFFNDVRVFGWMKVKDEKGWLEELAKYGPDVNSNEFTVDYLRKVLKSSKRPIKVVILDQKKIGGLGNIYANDGLFYAGIDPRRPSNEVAENRKEVKRLWKSLRWVIEQGLKYGGASERNYVHLDGLGGEYQNHFLVYGGGKCKKCGRELEKIKLGGRSSWFCSRCQN